MIKNTKNSGGKTHGKCPLGRPRKAQDDNI
jgi:hypothetical protein